MTRLNATAHRPALSPPVGARDRILGPDGAIVTLVEYGDYECPQCGEAHSVVQRLLQKFAGRLRLVFRNFPLAQAHAHAVMAAEAAEAAAAQDKFWQMHDYLFEHQTELDNAALSRHAAAVGLDVERFDRELTQRMHHARVTEDFRSGARSGVNGTPTFFINGLRHNGGYDFDTLAAAIENAAPVD